MRQWTVATSCVLVVMLSAVAWCGDNEEPVFKYENGRCALTAYRESLRKAKADYDRAVRTARKGYLIALDLALKDAMAREDLAEANRVDAEKKKVEQKLNTPKPAVADDAPVHPLPASAIAMALVGTWTYPNNTRVVFRPDGTWKATWGNGRSGAWKHLGGRRFKWGNNIVELAENLKSFKNPNPKAKHQIVVKVEAGGSTGSKE